MNPPGLRPGETPGVPEPAANELVAARQRLVNPGGNALSALRVYPHGCVAGRLVERRMRRHDAGHAARHRLDDRDAEALEPRRVDERGGAAVERSELVVADVAVDRSELQAVEQRLGRTQRLEVLAPIVGGRREDVRPFRTTPFRREGAVDTGIRHGDALTGYPERIARVRRGELGVGEDDVAALRLPGV